MEVNAGLKMEYNMNPCKECIVDVICIKECPMFEIDLERLQTDELIYTKRCMNNIEHKSYKISKNIKVKISSGLICWVKNGKWHRDNDQPAIIFYGGTRRYWYKNGKCHRDNDQPAIIFDERTQQWFKDGVQYEPSL